MSVYDMVRAIYLTASRTLSDDFTQASRTCSRRKRPCTPLIQSRAQMFTDLSQGTAVPDFATGCATSID